MQLRQMSLGLLFLALALTFFQFHIGIRTDEAKYLLNIPYPHPPFIRSIFGWTDGWIAQEIFWRFILSLVLIFSGFLFRGRDPIVTLLAWITAPAVLLAAGTVMLAPITALYAVFLLWILGRDQEKIPHPGLIGVIWLIMLFSAYQSVLLGPLLLGILLRKQTGWLRCGVVLGVPLLLLLIYTAGHPLSAASFILQGTKDADLTFGMRLWNVWSLWLLGGGAVGTVAGLIGIVRSKNIWVIGSFVLFTLYVFLGSFSYYAIFFTPFFVWGIAKLPASRILRAAVVIGSILTLWYFQPWPGPSIARDAVRALSKKEPVIATLVIRGPFGHEWQYESGAPVLRYGEDLPVRSWSILICTQECPLPDGEIWKAIPMNIPGVFGMWKNAQWLY